MKNAVLLLTLIFYCTISKCQIKRGIQPEYDCKRIQNLNFKQRLKKYPFNKIEKVMLISFLPVKIENEYIRWPIENDTIVWSRVRDTLTLNSGQVNKLSDIIFNWGFESNTYKTTISTAIGINMAILFLDSSGHIFEYSEVCFECGEIYLIAKNKDQSIGYPCNQKFDKIKSFAVSAGLKLSD
jgi:hypothetical protein